MNSKKIIDHAKARIDRESLAVAAVSEVLDEEFVLAARVISACEGKVFVSGSGTSGTIARRMAHLLSVSGTPAVFLQPMDALHGSLGAVTEKDIVILISKGGGSVEINDLAQRSKDRGAGVIALTCTADTPLTKKADISQITPVPEEADMGGVLAMGTTLGHAAWGDALASVLMHAKGYSWSAVHHSHPGGAVGNKTELPEQVTKIDLPPLTLQELRGLKNFS